MLSCGQYVYSAWMNIGKKCVRLSTIAARNVTQTQDHVHNPQLSPTSSTASYSSFPVAPPAVLQMYKGLFPQFAHPLLLPVQNKFYKNSYNT